MYYRVDIGDRDKVETNSVYIKYMHAISRA